MKKHSKPKTQKAKANALRSTINQVLSLAKASWGKTAILSWLIKEMPAHYDLVSATVGRAVREASAVRAEIARAEMAAAEAKENADATVLSPYEGKLAALFAFRTGKALPFTAPSFPSEFENPLAVRVTGGWAVINPWGDFFTARKWASAWSAEELDAAIFPNATVADAAVAAAAMNAVCYAAK